MQTVLLYLYKKIHFMPFTGENCHKQCVNQNFEFFILNTKAVLTFYSICNIFRNFEYTSYSIYYAQYILEILILIFFLTKETQIQGRQNWFA